MAHRKSFEELDRPFNREELDEERRKLEKLSPWQRLEAYRARTRLAKATGDQIAAFTQRPEARTRGKMIWKSRRQRPPRRD